MELREDEERTTLTQKSGIMPEDKDKEHQLQPATAPFWRWLLVAGGSAVLCLLLVVVCATIVTNEDPTSHARPSSGPTSHARPSSGSANAEEPTSFPTTSYPTSLPTTSHAAIDPSSRSVVLVSTSGYTAGMGCIALAGILPIRQAGSRRVIFIADDAAAVISSNEECVGVPGLLEVELVSPATKGSFLATLSNVEQYCGATGCDSVVLLHASHGGPVGNPEDPSDWETGWETGGLRMRSSGWRTALRSLAATAGNLTVLLNACNSQGIQQIVAADAALMSNSLVIAVGAAADSALVTGFTTGEYWRHFVDGLAGWASSGVSLIEAHWISSNASVAEIRSECPAAPSECILYGTARAAYTEASLGRRSVAEVFG